MRSHGRFISAELTFLLVLAGCASDASTTRSGDGGTDATPDTGHEAAVSDAASSADVDLDALLANFPKWDGKPIHCGGAPCMGIDLGRYAPPPCCPSGADQPVCGILPGYDEGIPDCVERAQKGTIVDESTCPTVVQITPLKHTHLEWLGCCRPDNRCAGWDNELRTGCALNPRAENGGDGGQCDYNALTGMSTPMADAGLEGGDSAH